MPSLAPVVRSRPTPLCARRGTSVCHYEHAEQTRGIGRGLYVERMIVGTHHVHGLTQASSSSFVIYTPLSAHRKIKCFLLVVC